jgi:hypothetical protein
LRTNGERGDQCSSISGMRFPIPPSDLGINRRIGTVAGFSWRLRAFDMAEGKAGW